MTLKLAPQWFTATAVSPRITRYEEPFVNELVRANFWRVQGRDRDLVVDTGLGVAALTPELPELFEHDPIVVLTHGHLDHMGGAHEFSTVLAHQAEPITDPPPGSLHGPTLAQELGLDEELPELLLEALPHPGYDPATYRLMPSAVERYLQDGDRIELGDRAFTALHLPGHSPGQLALYDERSHELFSGDVIYDDLLLDQIHGADPVVYRESLKRLRTLTVAAVYPGHGAPFGQARLHELIDAYLQS